MKKDLLTLGELSAKEIEWVLKRSSVLKKARKAKKNPQTLKGKTLAMVFEKPSTRTKASFDVAMYELGGHSLTLDSSSSQLGRGETYQDTGRVLSRFVHGIMLRTFAQKNLEQMAEGSSVPVINGLSDLYHPCQILTDLFTAAENGKNLKKGRIAYVGDGNNMANTWILAAKILGFELRIATPRGFETSKEMDTKGFKNIVLTNDPIEAVLEADVVNTDTWFSMGQEVSAEKRGLFEPYQVNRSLLKNAKKDAIVLHCLPAHRGEEITDGVMDGPQSRVFDEAENRLHVQKAILERLLK